MRNRGFEIISSFKDKHINLPTRKTSKSAGYDIEAAEDKIIKAGQMAVIATGLKAYMQDDEYLGIHIRSSLAFKKHLNLVNSQGVIDADYYNNPDNEGHIMFQFVNFGVTDVTIKKGERIGQGIFLPFLKADQDETMSTRTGGFGSSNQE